MKNFREIILKPLLFGKYSYFPMTVTEQIQIL